MNEGLHLNLTVTGPESPISRLIQKSVRCALCDASGIGTCNCWTQCACGRTVRSGGLCANGNCTMSQPLPQEVREAPRLEDAELIAICTLCDYPGACLTSGQLLRRARSKRIVQIPAGVIAAIIQKGLALSNSDRLEISRAGAAALEKAAGN